MLMGISSFAGWFKIFLIRALLYHLGCFRMTFLSFQSKIVDFNRNRFARQLLKVLNWKLLIRKAF